MRENTRDNLSILWNVFDPTCATRFWWIPQWFKIFGDMIGVTENRRKIGNGGRREPLQLVLLPRFSVRARRKSLDDRKSLVSVTDHAVGVGTYARVAWQFRVISLRKYISKNSREESRARIAVDQETEATSSLKDSTNPKSVARKDFSENEELDLMVAAELTWCFDFPYLIYEIAQCRAVKRQKGEHFLYWVEDWRMFWAEDTWVLFKKRCL